APRGRCRRLRRLAREHPVERRARQTADEERRGKEHQAQAPGPACGFRRDHGTAPSIARTRSWTLGARASISQFETGAESRSASSTTGPSYSSGSRPFTENAITPVEIAARTAAAAIAGRA